MAFLRINAQGQRPVLHRSPQDFRGALDRALDGQHGTGPVIIMTHGYKFNPGEPRSCPHRHILSAGESPGDGRVTSWPRRLGFGREKAHEGLGIAFGWSARGRLRDVRGRAEKAGAVLAQLVAEIKTRAPEREVHILTHSLGAHVALAAMARGSAGDLGRVVVMNPAAFQSQALRALATPAGETAELITVTSRENAFYDRLFETIVPRPVPGDRALGRGIERMNALTLQLDNRAVLAALAEAGFPIAPPLRRVCHWSPYLRPGVFPFYRALFRGEAGLELATLRRMLDSGATPAAVPPVRPAAVAFPLPTA